MHLFANGFWDMHHLFGNVYTELEERLYDADTSTRIRLMDDFFLIKIRNSDTANTLAAACAGWMADHTDSRCVPVVQYPLQSIRA